MGGKGDIAQHAPRPPPFHRAEGGRDAVDGDGLGLGQVVALGVVSPHGVHDVEGRQVRPGTLAPVDAQPYHGTAVEVDGGGVLGGTGEHHAAVRAGNLGGQASLAATLALGSAVALLVPRCTQFGVGGHDRTGAAARDRWATRSSSSRCPSSSGVVAGAAHTKWRHT